ncbi:unnamed protein product [Victoria cruziana]
MEDAAYLESADSTMVYFLTCATSINWRGDRTACCNRKACKEQEKRDMMSSPGNYMGWNIFIESADGLRLQAESSTLSISLAQQTKRR